MRAFVLGSVVVAIICQMTGPSLANDYEVTHVYHCARNVDQSNEGTCTVTIGSPRSCEEALQEHAKLLARDDICRACIRDKIDEAHHYTGAWDTQSRGQCEGM
jgi:hypothetical protein